MAEDAEHQSKTEEPTDRKIQNALEQGNVPFSRETSMFGSLLAILVIVMFFAGAAVAAIARALSTVLEASGSSSLSVTRDGEQIVRILFEQVGVAMVPVFILLFVFGFSAAIMQNKPSLVFERIKPQLSRISIAKGWVRLFGINGLVEFGKIIFKLVSISIISAIVMNSIATEITVTALMHPFGLLATIRDHATLLLASLCVAAAILASADLAWSRVHWFQKLRMTRDEVRKDAKQSEGDPLLKQRRLSLARGRSRQRMMAQVPLATLVLANPTHFSVALRYDADRDAAPVVVAKGQDLVALKIREIAEKNDVPVVENKELARSLYDSAQVNQMIPPEFYRAVAEIVLFLMARRSAGLAT